MAAVAAATATQSLKADMDANIVDQLLPSAPALPTPPPSTRKLRSSLAQSAAVRQDAHDDETSTTSKSEGSRASSHVSHYVDAPLSPPSSTHSSTADAKEDHKPLPPLRPAYLYLEGEDAEPPAEPEDDIKGVPVFTPTWEEFKDFYSYCSRIDEWGMRAGVVKIIPPKEWLDALPRLDGRQEADNGQRSSRLGAKAGERYTEANRLSQVRIKNSIEQIFMPSGPGVWRQSNVVHPARVVNAKQWADICAQESQRGPEMQRMKEVAQRKEADEEEDGVRTRSGRGRPSAGTSSGPSTGRSGAATKHAGKSNAKPRRSSKHAEENGDESVDASLSQTSKAGQASGSQSKPKAAERTTQEEWDEFDYKRDWCKEAGMDANPQDWSMSACRAIEQEYWRGLNYGKAPMYGADLSGTLFTPETQHWNIGMLDNILTRLRLKRKLPGVTTPYLYFGMWRATFAWHVEDMDLYSINYIHFGAPKQWYSIRQADKQRFELAMAAAFPADSSRCRHFMRHKSYLASPAFLKSAAGSVKPLRVVQRAQEIILTYPYGYHSGYNLGFNCAESVNFALERWLDIGRKAGYCDCSNDTVKMDVDAMLEESREMEELERKRVERERKREEEEQLQKSEDDKAEARREKERERRKRKKEENARLEALGLLPAGNEAHSEEVGSPAKKAKVEQAYPCEFCVSTLKEDLVLIHETSDEKKPVRRAHRLCASFLPETWVAPNPKAETNARAPKEMVMGVDGIPKARWSLKCQLCKEPAQQKRGAKVQCTFGRCSRTSHVSCALLEESGWMLDVLPDAKADAVEGKVNGKLVGKAPKAAMAIETPVSVEAIDEDAVRMVVLCRTHNPREREREARRKSMVVREFLTGLQKGDRIYVRISSSVYETPFIRYEGPAKEEDTLDEGEVILLDGKRVKGGKVVIDADAWRKADDTVWYREEAKAKRLEEEAKRRKITGEATTETAEPPVIAPSIPAESAVASASAQAESKANDQAAKEAKLAEKQRKDAEKAQKAAEREQKRLERERAKGERELKKEEREKKKAEKVVKQSAQPADAVTHDVHPQVAPQAHQSQPVGQAQPRQDNMQYIRDWKPRQPAPAHYAHSQPGNVAPSLGMSHGASARHPAPFTMTNNYSRLGASPSQTSTWHAAYGTLPDKRMHHGHPGPAPQSFPGGVPHMHSRGTQLPSIGAHLPDFHFAPRPIAHPFPQHFSMRHFPSPDVKGEDGVTLGQQERPPFHQQQQHLHLRAHELISPRSKPQGTFHDTQRQ